MAVKKPTDGAVLSMVRIGDDLRSVIISVTCPHGITSKPFSSKKVRRLGETYFKVGVALNHEAKYKCDCELTQAPDVKTKRTRKKKEVAEVAASE